MPELWYAETSAINFLCNRFAEPDALATRDLQTAKGRLWLMSPVTYYEIALTRDADRRDELLGFAQHLLHDELLASPEEMIIGFIDRGCPLLDPITEWKSRMPLSAAWHRVANRSDLTFELQQEVIQPATAAQRHLGNIAKRILSSVSLDPNDWTEAEHLQIVIELARKKLPPRKPFNFIPDDVHAALERLTIFYIFTMFCCLNTLNPLPYLTFWQRNRLEDPLSRAWWLIEKHSILFLRGPFLEMALATIVQFRGKPTRGLIFDILHFSYLPWVQQFLTADSHYNSAAALSWHPNAHKIREINKENLKQEHRRIEYPQELMKSNRPMERNG